MKEILLQKLDRLGEQAKTAFLQGKSEEELYQVKVTYLGKKGLLTDILKELGHLSQEDRPQVGSYANQLKNLLEQEYVCRIETLRTHLISQALEKEKIDTTLPGVHVESGHIHPVSRVLFEMKQIFRRLSFDICEGPEIETDYYNFEALAIPADHPARDMQDTFYFEDGSLLRTHTSPVQIRVMEKKKPPIRMVAPGVVYRCDSDLTHSPMFHQIEGLVVDRGITLAHLKGTIEVFLNQVFQSKTNPGYSRKVKIKLRPSYFPFTEPSAEVDIACVLCNGDGCRVCKNTGWLEIMGCGMVDPFVLEEVKIDPEVYTGFAFGIGIERVAMLKYRINDIRLFYENDRRFLEQF